MKIKNDKINKSALKKKMQPDETSQARMDLGLPNGFAQIRNILDKINFFKVADLKNFKIFGNRSYR